MTEDMKKTIAALFAVSLLASACSLGASADEETPVAGGGGGTAMCAPGATDCVDVAVDDEGGAAGTRPSDDTLRDEAQALLGVNEDELADDVRVGRRGDEQMMLTEDYQVGRFTAELDEAEDGGFHVTVVTVELGDSPETFRS
jgi:hypothetical protein